MKAIFAGGTHHNRTHDITNASASLPMTPAHGDADKEVYLLSSVKNLNGSICVVYKHPECLQTELNEVLKQFN